MKIERSKNFIQFISRIVAVLMYITFIILYFFDIDIDINLLSKLVIIISISEIIMIGFNKRIKNIGLFTMFFLYNWVCMNGFVIAYFFDKSYINFTSLAKMAYLDNIYYPEAIIIANIVLLTFVLIAEFYTNKSNKKSSSSITTKTKNEIAINNSINEKGSKFVDRFTILILSIATIYLAYVIFSKRMFLQNYKYVLSIKSENPLLSHSNIITSLSIAMLFSSGTKKGIKIGSIVYLFTMLLHFSIGNRGEVLYSTVIILALYSLRFKTIKLKHIIIVGVILVTIIPMVRIMREGNMSLYNLNPLSSVGEVLCEEGFQISPFTYIVEYLHEGHNYTFGMTYLNSFLDFILRRVGLQSPFIGIEEYVIKMIMPYKGMAFSMIAELYYNFTIFGACFAYAIFSIFLRRIDQRIYYNEINVSQKALYSMIAVEMINLTRNDATTLPVYLAYTIIFYMMYKINLMRKKN